MNFVLLAQKMRHRVCLIVWIGVVFAILFIPLQIINDGFLPGDDALRYAAKAVSGTTWQHIIVMRSVLKIDPNPGWQAFLQWIHDRWECGQGVLLVFSVVFLMWLLLYCGLPWMRRPEAWLAGLLTVSLFSPESPVRFARGRPYILGDAVLITLLFLWVRVKEDRPGRLTLALTTILVAVFAWMEGAWYLLVLPGVAILFAGMWRSAFWYGGCWLAGSFLGGALTGHPWEFLFQNLNHLFFAFGHATSSIQLVGELIPSTGQSDIVLLVAALLLWRAISSGWSRSLVLNPVFMMMVLGWLLGLEIRRFWLDWSMPALMVWVAQEVQFHLERHLAFDSTRRLFITLLLAAGTFCGFTADRDTRWTTDSRKDYEGLDFSNPRSEGWLPGPDGIVYNSDMEIFFQMFFRYPTAPWRYVLGFEPGLMLPEDLAVHDKVQSDDFRDANDFRPWVDKMRPEDRLIIHMIITNPSGTPAIPELEWLHAGDSLWIGRLRQ